MEELICPIYNLTRYYNVTIAKSIGSINKKVFFQQLQQQQQQQQQIPSLNFETWIENLDEYDYETEIFGSIGESGIRHHLSNIFQHYSRELTFNMLWYYILTFCVIFVFATLLLMIIANLFANRKVSNWERRYSPKPLYVKNYWFDISPPSLDAQDTPVIITEHDFQKSKTLLSNLLNFDPKNAQSVLSKELKNKDSIVTYAEGTFKPMVSERDVDGDLILPTENYPLQAHWEFTVEPVSLRRKHESFKFGTAEYPSRLMCAWTTWKAYFGASVANFVHSILVIPTIMFCSDKTLKSLVVKPAKVIFCRNELQQSINKSIVTNSDTTADTKKDE